jgi:exodeoxyribonuclease V beta subunit
VRGECDVVSGAIPSFLPDGPLPVGVPALIEASAGTGKTWTAAHLVCRLVIEEGVPAERILLVTFTRAATAEMRARVRARLELALRLLRGEAAGGVDEALAATADPAGPDAASRRGRAEAALADFDRLLVTTIHGFCQRVLAQAVLESGAETDPTVMTDASDMREDLVADVWVAEGYAVDGARRLADLGVGRGALSRPAEAAVRNPDAVPFPDPRRPVDPSAFREAARAAWFGGARAAFEREAADPGQPVRRGGSAKFSPRNLAKFVAAVDAWLEGSAGISATELQKYVHGFEKNRPVYSGELAARLAVVEAATDGAIALFEKGHLLASLALRVRDRFFAETARRGVLTYDDMVRRLASAVRAESEAGRDDLVRSIRARWDAVLVDEFQDTDPEQWRVFREAFAVPGKRLVLVGDPKQAIYGFRGADFETYMAARAGAARTRLGTNHRSDGALVGALERLFAVPGVFGLGDRLSFEPVSARFEGTRLECPAGTPVAARAPLHVRWLDVTGFPDAEGQGRHAGRLVKGELEPLLCRRIAHDVLDLLALRPSVRRDAADPGRALHPGDVAVLVRTNRQAAAVLTALRRAAIPAVLVGSVSVFVTDEARQLLAWLDAVVDGTESAARIAAATPLFGWTPAAMGAFAAGDEGAGLRWDRWRHALRGAAAEIDRGDLLGCFRRFMRAGAFAAAPRSGGSGGGDVPASPASDPRDFDLAERLLRLPEGERRLSNLRQLLDLAHRALRDGRLGAAALREWLRARIAGPDAEVEEQQVRLERDDAAVKVMTLHKAKGLEFPVVFAPFLWSDPKPPGVGAVAPGDDGGRVLCLLDRDHPLGVAPARRAREAQVREELRLLYVAATRARHRLVLYVADVDAFPASPLGSVLASGAAAPEGDECEARRLRAAAAVAGPDLAARTGLPDGAPLWNVERAVDDRTPRRFVAPVAAPAALETARFDREALGDGWRRWSFTRLQHGMREREPHPEFAGPASDEASEPAPFGPAEPALPAGAGALEAIRAGAETGNALHALLETIDYAPFAPARPSRAAREALAAAVRERLPRHGLRVPDDEEPVVRGVIDALRTPLRGTLGPDVRLADVARADRLNEVPFLLAFPADRARTASLLRLAEALDAAGDEGLPSDYRERIAGALAPDAARRLHGVLAGAIDLVFRRDGRFYLADFKSNRLHGDPPYGPAAMREAMAHHHYPLQYHLYVLALHRWLRGVLPGYDYDRHFGGAYYLFLRGMTGPKAPAYDAGDGAERTSGVCFDRPPRAVIEALDALCEGGAS